MMRLGYAVSYERAYFASTNGYIFTERFRNVNELEHSDEPALDILFGPKGDSYFNCAVKDVMHSRNVASEVEAYFKKFEKLKDDRSLAILAAILVEQFVNRLLTISIPRMTTIIQKRELTLSMKLELLSALNLIPSRFIVGAECVRTIRNYFAHEHGDRFSELPQRYKDSMKKAIRMLDAGDPTPKQERKLFRSLCRSVIVGLSAYEPNVRCMINLIHSGPFKEMLYYECKRIVYLSDHAAMAEVDTS